MAGSAEERAIAAAGSAAAPGWVRAWEGAEKGTAPRAVLSEVPPHALWFVALWHLLRVWTWASGGSGSEAGDEAAVGTRAACAAVRAAACAAGLGAEAAPGAEGDWVGTWTGKGGGSDGTVGGPCGGKARRFVGRGAGSPADCWG